MINTIPLSYFLIYFLTYLGFVLRRVASYEYNEIARFVKSIVIITTLSFYGALIYLIGRFDGALLIVLMIFFLYAKLGDSRTLLRIHNVIMYGVSFFILQSLLPSLIYLIFIPTFLITIEKAFSTFHIKYELMSVTLLGIIYGFSLAIV